VVDQIADLVDATTRPGKTDERPLVGGEATITAPDRLADLYGTEADDVRTDGGDVAAEVRQAVLREGAVRLEDYWVRRVPRAFFDLDGGLAALEPAATEMARLLDWSPATRQQELDACRRRHDADHALFATEGNPRAH
jgi:glycerol-3-phosphate dehydrogenase